MSWFHAEWGTEAAAYLQRGENSDRCVSVIERAASCFDAMPATLRNELITWFDVLERMGPHDCGDRRAFIFREMVFHSALSGRSQARATYEALPNAIGAKDPRVKPSYRELASFVFYAGPIVRLLALRNRPPPRVLVESAAALLQAMRERLGDGLFTEWVNSIASTAEEDLLRLREV